MENNTIKLVGTLDYISGTVYCEEYERYDAKIYHDKLLKPIFGGS